MLLLTIGTRFSFCMMSFSRLGSCELCCEGLLAAGGISCEGIVHAVVSRSLHSSLLQERSLFESMKNTRFTPIDLLPFCHFSQEVSQAQIHLK